MAGGIFMPMQFPKGKFISLVKADDGKFYEVARG